VANIFLTPSIIAKEALIVLENNLVFGGLVHRAYDTEYRKVGDTIRIRQPATFESKVWAGSWSAQDISEKSVSVKLDTHLDISFEITEKQLALDIVDFSRQIVQPAMRAHAQKIDELLASLYVYVPYYQVLDISNDANKLASVATARAILNDNKVPPADRYAVVCPTDEAHLLVVPSFLHAEKRGDTEALKEASLARIFGLDWYMDQNIQKKAAGGDFTTAAVPTRGSADTSKLILTETAKVGKKGDIYTITCTEKPAPGVKYSLLADCSTGGEVAVSPPVNHNITSGAVTAVMQKTTGNDLLFHKNAFALVTAPLSPPMGGAVAAVESLDGLSCRLVYGYDIGNKLNKCSIDLLVGVKCLMPELATRLIV